VTPVREAFVLPLVFLTVVLLGGVHFTTPVAIQPPALFSLVLAALMVGVLVQTGTLDPTRLMGSDRSPLANLNGLIVLLAAFMATAQMLSLMTPASGLPSLALNLFFLIAILQLLAANVDRIPFLRVWAVTLLSSFTIKFILLTALSGPADRPLARALQVLVEGLTLGAFSQPVEPASSGYLAFAALALYLFGLALLPGMQRSSLEMQRSAIVRRP
jgi:hypothetical protein